MAELDGIDSILATVAEFSSRYSQIGIILPSGWLGKPYDEYYSLIEVRRESESLVLEFSWDHRISILSPRSILVSSTPQHGGRTEERITIRDFNELVFERSTKVRRDYRSGELTLVAEDWLSS